ncbi:hypothetical protein BDZ88DRAFT_214491 [Geranomyces variabilis]|nr:hypothetical protein BDZ88DRAFT_214491 [Geranomyces variabilis]KAJ3135059.1 hypothetical protein HDU90_004087 [Geranomyces variabilis]
MPDKPTPQPSAFASSHSMRENYTKFGVERYYENVAHSYRNPHSEGVRKVLFNWMDKWLAHDSSVQTQQTTLTVLDMAAGSGEVTEALDLWTARRTQPARRKGPPLPQQLHQQQLKEQALSLPSPISISITATDPFTSPAYTARTSRPCLPLSFTDIANGMLPTADPPVIYDLVVCSFALHLLTDPSEIFSLLWELSSRARWLLIIAPGKQPVIKEGWGWAQWDVNRWCEARGNDKAEIVEERCRGRVFKSVNHFS